LTALGEETKSFPHSIKHFSTPLLVLGAEMLPTSGVRGDEGDEDGPFAISSAQSTAALVIGSDGNRVAEGWEKAKCRERKKSQRNDRPSRVAPRRSASGLASQIASPLLLLSWHGPHSLFHRGFWLK